MNIGGDLHAPVCGCSTGHWTVNSAQVYYRKGDLESLYCRMGDLESLQLCARFGAVIIVDFYIDDFIFALFIFMKDGKAVNNNGSEIIGLINLKYGKRTACRDNYFTENAVFSREAGKRSTMGNKS